MREHLGFLKTSSAVVKIAAWIFLLFGLITGISLILGYVPADLRFMVVIGAGVYLLLFFFLYLIAKIADLLTNIINEIHELKKE